MAPPLGQLARGAMTERVRMLPESLQSSPDLRYAPQNRYTINSYVPKRGERDDGAGAGTAGRHGGGHHLPERGQRLHRVRGIGRRCGNGGLRRGGGAACRARAVDLPGAVREPRHLWAAVPRTGVRDRYAQRPRGRLCLPRQPVAALHRRPHGGQDHRQVRRGRRWRSSPTTPPSSPLIPGISADKADRIQQEFKRMFGMRELIAYLAPVRDQPPEGHGGLPHLRPRGP